jgi:hypothetical protein
MKLPQVNLRDLISKRFTCLRLAKIPTTYLNSSRAAPKNGILDKQRGIQIYNLISHNFLEYFQLDKAKI